MPAAVEVELTTSSDASLTDAFVHSAALASPSRLHAKYTFTCIILMTASTSEYYIRSYIVLARSAYGA